MELTNEYFVCVCVFVLFVFYLYVILIKNLQGYVILFYNGGNLTICMYIIRHMLYGIHRKGNFYFNYYYLLVKIICLNGQKFRKRFYSITDSIKFILFLYFL